MRKVVLWGGLAACFGLALALESFVTERPEDLPGNRLVLELGGNAPRTIPDAPPGQPGPVKPAGAGRPAERPGPKDGAPPPGPGKGAEHEYVVRDLDTLWDIAHRELGEGSEWRSIAALNGIEPADLKPGMRLKLPRKGGTVAPVPAKAGGRTHTVRKGETLDAIAEQYLGSSRRWREIQELNGIADPTKVTVGQVLKLPDS